MRHPETRGDSLIPISDYLLAHLRHELHATHELYVKWNLIGAFNGAVLATSKGNLQILFSRHSGPGNEKSLNTVICSLGDTEVNLFSYPETPSESLCEPLIDAYERATTLAAQHSDWMNRVRFVHVSVLFAATESTAEEVAREIAGEIGALLESTPIISHPMPALSAFKVGTFDADISFPLTKSLTQEETRERMMGYLPEITLPLTGFGQIIINHDGTDCRESHLKWAHIYARHFYLPVEPE